MPDNVFRAKDATMVVGAGETDTLEGTAADALVSRYDLSNVVGRLTHLTVSVSSGLKPFYEIGRRYPTQLTPGVVQITGTAERAHVNGALIRLLLGDGAVSPPSAANFVQPAFNIVTTLRDPARPANDTRVTIFGARFDTWTYTIPTDDFVMEGVTFQALRLAFEET